MSRYPAIPKEIPIQFFTLTACHRLWVYTWAMKPYFLTLAALLIVHCSTGPLPETFPEPSEKTGWLEIEGAWAQTSYVRASDKVRYMTDGYMIFAAGHWLQVSFFNRDHRSQDFSEAHYGTYQVTGPNTLDLNVDLELHMDPKSEFQENPVFYGEPAAIKAIYKEEGDVLTIDLPSGAQVVLKRGS